MAKKSFGRWLEKLLINSDISRAELSRRLDVNGSTVTGWIGDRMKPRLETALRIADMFGVPYEELEKFGYDIPPLFEKREPLIISSKHEAYDLIEMLFSHPQVAKHVEAILKEIADLCDVAKPLKDMNFINKDKASGKGKRT